MTIWAMRSLKLILSYLPSLAIYFMRDWFKMCGIDAGSYTAQMIQLHADRDRAARLLEGETVRFFQLPVHAQNAVSFSVLSSRPNVATRFSINLGVFLQAGFNAH